MREMYIHKDRNKGVYIYTNAEVGELHIHKKTKLYIYKGRSKGFVHIQRQTWGVVHVQTDKGRRDMYMY